MILANIAAYIDAVMVVITTGAALTAGTVKCFVQRKSDSKWLYADTTWSAVEPVGADIPTMTHFKGGLWRLAHTPADVNDVYSISAVDDPVTCYPDNRSEYVRQEWSTVAAVFAFVVENGKSFAWMLRVMFAPLSAKSSGGGKNFYDNAGTKVRIAATIDANNDRTAVVLDGD